MWYRQLAKMLLWIIQNYTNLIAIGPSIGIEHLKYGWYQLRCHANLKKTLSFKNKVQEKECKICHNLKTVITC